MPYEEAAHVIDYAYRLGGRYLTFLGGEPTLHSDLPRLAERAVGQGYAQVMVNTNGLTDVTRLGLDPEKLHYVSFSLDGASPSTHDSVRGKGTHATTLGTIRRAVREGFRCRLICTISQMNVHEAVGLLRLAEELGVDMVNFHVFSEEGRGIEHAKRWSLAPREWVAFCDELNAMRDQIGISVWYPPTYATRWKLREYVEEGYRGCVGTFLDRVSIFPDGRCYVCSVLFDVPMNFALLTDSGLKLNPSRNEFEMFAAAMYRAEEPWLMGCPAEEILIRQGRAPTPEGLISMCRLWKLQV